MKRYSENEEENKQIRIIASLVASGKSDAEIAEHLAQSKIVNLQYAEVFWTAKDIQQIRTDHGFYSEEMKFCPNCYEPIKQKAVKCRHCGVFLNAASASQCDTVPNARERESDSRDAADAGLAYEEQQKDGAGQPGIPAGNTEPTKSGPAKEPSTSHKKYSNNETVNRQVQFIARLAEKGVSDAEIAAALMRTNAVNLISGKIVWTPKDIEQIRSGHGIAAGDETVSRQVQFIAELAAMGKSDAEIAAELMRAKAVKPISGEIAWTATDILRIRIVHGIGSPWPTASQHDTASDTGGTGRKRTQEDPKKPEPAQSADNAFANAFDNAFAETTRMAQQRNRKI